MAVKIRLKRLGKIRAPYYRIVVADSRTKRDGRVIEEIGKYHPTEEPSFIEINSDRAQYWLGVGAQPTEQVAALLKLSGDWGKFKGDANAKSTIRVAEPKPDKKAIYEAAVRAGMDEPTTDATTAKKKAAPKKKAAADEAPAGDAATVEAPAEAAEAPAAEAEAPAAEAAEAPAEGAEATAADEKPAKKAAKKAAEAPAEAAAAGGEGPASGGPSETPAE